MGNYYVYEHISPSGKRYIGITEQKPERRWRADGSGYRQNEHFMNAIKKYGWDNFEHSILFEGLSKEEACTKEKELIKKYKSDLFEYGYNRSEGGEHGELGEAAKQQISEAVKDLWSNPEYRQHMSEAHKGQARTGWHHSDDTKRKMSEIAKKRFQDPKQVEKISLINKRRSETPEGRAHLVKSAKAAWANKESREKIIASKRGNHYRACKVRCVETGEVFQSVTVAAQAIGRTRESVGRVCRGLGGTAGGKHWEFV